MSPAKPNPAKILLRTEVSGRIAALTPQDMKLQSQVIYEKVINHPWYRSSNRIALYMNTNQEVDTSQILAHVVSRGAAAFVPQYAGGSMRMLKYLDGDQKTMDITKHGIAQHSQTQLREDGLDNGGLDLIIAPGLAFTKAGARLGHGGGYYDKYLSKIRTDPTTKTKVISLAFTCQLVPEVPMDDNDQSVDEVISAD